MNIRIRWLLPLWLFCACSAPPPGIPDAGELVSYTPAALPSLSSTGLPQLPNGNTMVLTLPGVRLEFDATKKDALTALGDCAQWVTGCFQPGSRSLDACFNSVPSCTTDEPWNEASSCCPTACKQGYRTRRAAGAEPWGALDDTLFIDGTCAPGVNELLGRP